MSATGSSQRRVAVIIPAAGLSTRFGRNKLHEMIEGKSVLLRSIEAFINRTETAALIIATTHGISPPWSSLPPDVEARLSGGGAGDVYLTPGGTSRAESVWKALASIPAGVRWVAIHDAARPMVSSGMIDRVYAHAFQHGSAVPAMPVKLTIKQAAGPLPARVTRTLPRHELWEMQTPQVMDRTSLGRAYAECRVPLDQITDDAQVLELAGKPVWLVPGEERNLKITTLTDLRIAEAILRDG